MNYYSFSKAIFNIAYFPRAGYRYGQSQWRSVIVWEKECPICFFIGRIWDMPDKPTLYFYPIYQNSVQPILLTSLHGLQIHSTRQPKIARPSAFDWVSR